MTRRETKSDLKNEDRIAQFVAEAKGLQQQKITGRYAHQDRTFYTEENGQRKDVALVEIKCRPDYRLSELKTVFVDWRKMKSLCLTAQFRGLTPVLIIEFGDGIFSYSVKSYREPWLFRREVGGRTNQYRDHTDIKEIVHIPRFKFEKIELA